MTYFGNEKGKLEGYKKFWARASVKRPLVGFTFKSWLPVNEYRNTRALEYGTILAPEMIVPEDFFQDQEVLLWEGDFMDDDIIRGACPHQGIPWSCGMIGANLKVLMGSVLAEDMNIEYENMKPVATDMSNPWFRVYIELVEALVKHAACRYPVSHGPEIGPSDLAVTWRGHTSFIYDLFDRPQKVDWLLEECARVFRATRDEAWRRIPLWENGYYDAQYYLWSPGPICRMQEDAIMLFSRIYSTCISNTLTQTFRAGIPIHFFTSIRHPCHISITSWRSRTSAAMR